MLYDEHGQKIILKFSDLGRRIRHERKRLGLTQEQLAEKFGVDKSSVYLYERGDRPPTASHLQVFLDIGADVLFVLSGERAHRSMHSNWLHTTVLAIKELDESGAWQKLNWQERENLLARFLKRPEPEE